MAISTNGTVLARVAGALYNTQMSNATYEEVKTLDPSTLANALYARDFSSATDATVATTLVTNLGLTSVTGLTNWVAAQLTAAGSAKGAKIVELLNGFAQMTADATYGAAATAFNTKVDASLALSQTVGNKGGTFAAAGTVVVGGAFSLTIELDKVAGNSGDNTINGFVSGTTNASTLTAGDKIDGDAGNDTLSIVIDSNVGANTMTPSLTSVEKIVVRNLSEVLTTGNAPANIVDTLSLVQSTGVTSVTLDNSTTLGSLAVTNGSLAATYAVTNTPAEEATAAGISVSINSVELTGKTDTVKFSAQNAGSKVGTAAANNATLAVANSAGVEAVSADLSGTNFVTIDGAGNDTKTVSITGSGTNTIEVSGTNATLTIDASASTGTNKFVLGSSLTSADVVKGGSGSDTVSVTLTDATGVSLSGVETLRVEQSSTNGAVLSFAASTNVAVDVRDSTETDVFRFANLATTEVSFVGADTNAGDTLGLGVSTNDVSFGTVRLDTAYAGAADALTVKLGNQGVAAVGNYSGTIHASGIETVSIAQSDTGAANNNAYTITNSGLKSVSVTSDSAVTLNLNTAASDVPGYVATSTAVTASGSTVSLIDLSGVTGAATLNFGIAKGTFAAAAEVKTAVGGMTLTFGEEAATDTITVTGNKGNDSITTGAGGKFVANLGEGNDTFTGASLSTTVGGSATVNGGDGDDNITGSYAADVLNGDAGSDTLTGGLGADVMTGGAGSDTYVIATGAAKANGTAQVTGLTPIGLTVGETLRVTIGGVTYEQPAMGLNNAGTPAVGVATQTSASAGATEFSYSLDATLDAFVSNHALAIRGATGGLNGVVVTANVSTATALTFTATGTDTDSSTTGSRTSVGFTFTKPTASIVTTGSNAVAGTIYTDARDQFAIQANAEFSEAGETFSFKIGTTEYKVPFITSVVNSLTVYAAANPSLAGNTLEFVADIDSGTNGSQPGLLLTLQSTATTLPTVTAGNVYHATTGAAVATSATTVTDISYTVPVTPVAGVAGTSSVASASSYLSVGGVITQSMDVIAWGAGDKVDLGATALTATAIDQNNAADIAATGIVTFASVPATFAAALDAVATAINASDVDGSGTGETAAGEAALFQFAGKTYLFVSDAVNGHDRSDVVVELTGLPTTLVSGLTISSGDIINIG